MQFKNVKVTKNKVKPQQLAIHVYHSRSANSHDSALSLMFFCLLSRPRDDSPNLTVFWGNFSLWSKMEIQWGMLVPF